MTAPAAPRAPRPDLGGWWPLLRACLSLATPEQRRNLPGLVLLMLVNTMLEVVGVAAVLPFIAMVNDPGIVMRQPLLAAVSRVVAPGDPHRFIILASVGFLAVVVVKNLLSYLLIRMQGRYAYFEAARLGGELFRGHLSAPYTRHLRHHSAETITTVNFAVDQLFVAVLLGYAAALIEGLGITGILAVLVVAQPVAALAALVLIGGATGLIQRAMHRHMDAFGKANNFFYELRLRILGQGFGSFKELRVLGREANVIAAYQQARTDNARILVDNATLVQLPRLVLETVLMAAVIGLVLVTLLRGADTASITAVLGLFAVAAFRIMPAVNRMMMQVNNIKCGRDSVERVVADIGELAGMAVDTADGPPATFRSSLVLDDVHFAYPGSPRPVLAGLSLTVRQGEAVALVGASGAGKTTIADIVLGLLAPDRGRVLADGIDITGNPRSWRRHIGYVPQQIYLADDSLRRNVAYALPDGEIDDRRVRAALTMAQLDAVVAGLPHGLDTMLGEHGTRLSGGQRQRVGLARALYHDPALLVMDEATSALDNETEREITAAIEGLRGAKTMIIIAHRLTTVRRCDRLLLVENGRITAGGPYDDLVRDSESFRRIAQIGEPGGDPAASVATDHKETAQ